MSVIRSLSGLKVTFNSIRCLSIGQPKCTKNQFFDDVVQDLLKKLTGVDKDKIFRHRKIGKRLTKPTYKFMTSEQLENAIKEADSRIGEKLQMPPVLPPRKPINDIFVKDERLKGYLNSKFVFTDISFGKTDQSRTVVVRDFDGTLRKANWDEKDRMNEIYFPQKGRKLIMPDMFKPEFLKPILERGDYEFILDRACVQFEPDNPDYIRVTSLTYNTVNDCSAFSSLRSTRHYGPLVYYLAKNQNITNLLKENLETDRVEDAVWVIQLFNILNPESIVNKYNKGQELNFIEDFIEKSGLTQSELGLTFIKYKDLLNHKRDAL